MLWYIEEPSSSHTECIDHGDLEVIIIAYENKVKKYLPWHLNPCLFNPLKSKMRIIEFICTLEDEVETIKSQAARASSTAKAHLKMCL